MSNSRIALLFLLLLVALATPAAACMNDTSSNSAEGEFRSRYETPTPPRSDKVINWLSLGALGAGVAVSVAAIALARPFRKSKEPG